MKTKNDLSLRDGDAIKDGRLPEAIAKYSILTSRNQGFISGTLQRRIKRSSLLMIGCGLGSQIALLAARFGFLNFKLIDGDNVSFDNLNRQAFRYNHVGRNKAEVLSEMLLDINPNINVHYDPHYLKNMSKAEELIGFSDFVINMADPDPVMYHINNYAQSRGKMVLFPLNIMWGGYCLVFKADTPRLQDLLGGKKIMGPKFYVEVVERTFETFPPHLLRYYKKKGAALVSQGFFPQLGSTAYLTSSIVVSTMVRSLANLPVKLAPNPIFLDTWEEG